MYRRFNGIIDEGFGLSNAKNCILIVVAAIAIGSRVGAQQHSAGALSESETQRWPKSRNWALTSKQTRCPQSPGGRGVPPGPAVTDAALDHLKNLPNLQTVSLYATSITDAGLERLKD